MSPKKMAMFAAALLLAGCSQEPEFPEPIEDLPADPVLLPDVPKLSYAQANQYAKSVKVGMPQGRVEAMFGRPDRAGKQVFGRSTGQPWEGLLWEYVFSDVTPGKVLTIIFQQSQGRWLVHSGSWNE